MQNHKLYLLLMILSLIFFTSINNEYLSQQAEADDINFRTIFADISEKASPAVVKIEALSKAQAPEFDFYEYESQDEEKIIISGSGFIITPTGYILTNQHIVNNAQEIKVEMNNQTFIAEKIGSDFNLDLALLKIEIDKKMPSLDLEHSNNLRPGDWVIAIGNPHGLQTTTTIGVISALDRSISLKQDLHSRDYHNLIQTDAAINPGNSGGPLLNINGNVIGINTAIDTKKQNVSYSVPSSEFKDLIYQIKDYGKILRPWIGIHVQEISPEAAEFMELDSSERLLITNVDKESPAEKAGIEAGDILTKFNATEIKDSSEFKQKVKDISIDQKITLTLIRDKEEKEFALEIEEMPSNN